MRNRNFVFKVGKSRPRLWSNKKSIISFIVVADVAADLASDRCDRFDASGARV